MSIEIYKDSALLGNILRSNIKLLKRYTLGYVPTAGITQNYVLEYIPDSNEISTTIKFPPSFTNDDGDITIKFSTTDARLANAELQRGESFDLAGHEVTFYQEGGNDNFQFQVEIDENALSTLTDSAGEHLFERSIEYAVRLISATTFSFELDPPTINFSSLSDTTKFGYVRFYVTDSENNKTLLLKNEINNSDLVNDGKDIFSVSYEPLASGVQSKIRATREGFRDSTYPNAYRIRFDRINTRGDVNEEYSVTLEKNYGGLLGEQKNFTVSSNPQVIENYNYVTRLFDTSNTPLEGVTIENNDYTILSRFDEGLIETPRMKLELRKFIIAGNESNAQDELESYFIRISRQFGISQLLFKGTNDRIIPEEENREGNSGTRRFGPIEKDEEFYIEMTPQESTSQIELVLMHYGYLTETAEDGTPISSQDDVRPTTFKLTVNSGTGGGGEEDDEIIRPPNYYQLKESEMVKISTSAVTLKKILSIEPNGTINDRTPVYDSEQDGSDPTILRNIENEYGYDNLLHIYEFDVKKADAEPVKECYLQYRKVPPNASFDTTNNTWYYSQNGQTLSLGKDEGWYNVPISDTAVVDSGFGNTDPTLSVVLGANQQSILKDGIQVKQTVGLFIVNENYVTGEGTDVNTLQQYEFRSKIIEELLENEIEYQGAFTSRGAIFNPILADVEDDDGGGLG
jgi:hypothetical protein